MTLPPVLPTHPLKAIGRPARVTATLPLLVTPEWGRIRTARVLGGHLRV